MRNRWYHLPVLHTAFDHEKKVSWLELFYDLIFVAAIIQLGDALSKEVTYAHDALGPLAKFSALFVPLWFAWTGFTFFLNRFDVDDFIHRGMVLLQMFSVGAMAIAVPGAMKGEPAAFAASYAVAQGLIAAMYLRAYKQVPEAKPYSRYWGSVFGIGALIWAISVALPSPLNYVAMGLGIAAIIFSPVNKQSRALNERFPTDMEHLSERYGLLTIIVLGESFVKVLSYLAEHPGGGSIEYIGRGVLNLLITCCIWWIYFDDVAGSNVRKERGAWIVWLYGHLPLGIGITAVAVGVKKAITFDFAEVASAEYRWLLACSVAITFFAVAIIDSVTERRQAELSDRARVNVRFGSAFLVLLLAPAGATMSAGMFLGLVTVICVAQVIFDLMMAPIDARSMPEHIETTAVIAERRLAGGDAGKRVRFNTGNIVRKGTPAELKRDIYFFFIEGSWTRFLASLGFIYIVSNVFFAALYMLEPASISTSGSVSFGDAFAFSVQTMSTIGYGVLHPGTEYGNLLVAIEAAFGLGAVALATGLMFAKASRPHASVVFSKNVVVTTRHGERTLMFRAGNARGNEVVDATMSVSAMFDEISPEGHHLRRIVDIGLVRNRSPLFQVSWTVMHVLDEDSPLADLDFEQPNHPLQGLIVTMLGHDGTYGSTTYARHMYWPEDVKVGHRFVDALHQLEDGRLLIDFTMFHDTMPEAPQDDPEADPEAEAEAEAEDEVDAER